MEDYSQYGILMLLPHPAIRHHRNRLSIYQMTSRNL